MSTKIKQYAVVAVAPPKENVMGVAELPAP